MDVIVKRGTRGEGFPEIWGRHQSPLKELSCHILRGAHGREPSEWEAMECAYLTIIFSAAASEGVENLLPNAKTLLKNPKAVLAYYAQEIAPPNKDIDVLSANFWYNKIILSAILNTIAPHNLSDLSSILFAKTAPYTSICVTKAKDNPLAEELLNEGDATEDSFLAFIEIAGRTIYDVYLLRTYSGRDADSADRNGENISADKAQQAADALLAIYEALSPNASAEDAVRVMQAISLAFCDSLKKGENGVVTIKQLISKLQEIKADDLAKVYSDFEEGRA